MANAAKALSQLDRDRNGKLTIEELMPSQFGQGRRPGQGGQPGQPGQGGGFGGQGSARGRVRVLSFIRDACVHHFGPAADTTTTVAASHHLHKRMLMRPARREPQPRGMGTTSSTRNALG